MGSLLRLRLLGELPTLPSRYAILLGWATELPVLVRINYLDEAQRPASSDLQYWDAWAATENYEFKTDRRRVGQTDLLEDTQSKL